MNQDNGKTQNLRAFTAQVRGADGINVIGTAFAIDREQGLLLSCRHVVMQAINPKAPKLVHIYFPQIKIRDKRLFQGSVIYLDKFEDDVVLIKLVESHLPVDVEIAILGTATQSTGLNHIHNFRSFGYRRLQKYQGLPAEGQIIDFADKPDSLILFGDPVMLRSQNIDSGMSGAAVLDIDRNLVVGIISETWDSGRDLADRDTSFAVDGDVLSIAPLQVSIFQGFRYPLEPLPEPLNHAGQYTSEQSVRNFPLQSLLTTAPQPQSEWVERQDLMEKITSAITDLEIRLVGLIGFGGEGKSVLARQILEYLSSNAYTPDGIFWWSFNGTTDVDIFIESTLSYLGGKELSQTVKNPTLGVEIIGTLLQSRHFIFVLDGIEDFQSWEDDDYTLIPNENLKRCLDLFTSAKSQSLCIVTSRLPLTDFASNTKYKEYEIGGLSVAEGTELFRNLGINAEFNILQKHVEKWKGHALTISLVSSIISNTSSGVIPEQLDELNFNRDKSLYDGVFRVLDSYNERLHPEESAFIQILSIFRIPINNRSFATVFMKAVENPLLNQSLTNLSDEQFSSLVSRLVDARLVSTILHEDYDQVPVKMVSQTLLFMFEPQDKQEYTLHPLIKEYFQNKVASESSYPFFHAFAFNYFVDELHIKLKNFVSRLHYLSSRVGGYLSGYPGVADIQPIYEIIYHAAQIKAYDQAYSIYISGFDDLSQLKPRYILTDIFNAHDTIISLLKSFFVDKNFDESALVSPQLRSFLLNDVGLSLRFIGQLNDSVKAYRRSISYAIENAVNPLYTYVNLADVYSLLGDLESALNAANDAILSSNDVDDEWDKCLAFIALAWSQHLLGNSEAAEESFANALHFQKSREKQSEYLTRTRGIKHAQHLIKRGRLDDARLIIENGLNYDSRSNQDELVQRRRILADIHIAKGDFRQARPLLREALKSARLLQLPMYLAEVLISFGRLYIRLMQWDKCEECLLEALQITGKYNYLIHQIETLNLLALLAAENDNLPLARNYIERAFTDATNSKYSWGLGDAFYISAIIDIAENNFILAREHLTESMQIRSKIKDPNISQTQGWEAHLNQIDIHQGSNAVNEWQRVATIWDLRKKSDKETLETLFKYMKDPDYEVRIAAVNSITKYGQNAANLARTILTDSQDVNQIIALMQVLWKVRDIESTPLILSKLTIEDERVKEIVEEILSDFEYDNLTYLTDGLKSTNTRIQVISANILKKINNPNSIDALVEQLPHAKEEELVKAVANALVHFAQENLNRVFENIRTLDLITRANFVKVIGTFGGQSVLNLLLLSLDDKEFAVRVTASGILASGYPYKEKFEPLIKLLNDEHYAVRCNALSGLERLKDLRAVEPIIAKLSDENPKVREYAVYALGTLGDKSAIESLQNLMNDPEENVRKEVQQALSNLKRL